MKSRKIVIVDYGMGNLLSVIRAFEYCGAEDVVISSSADDVNNASYLVLPGVGAFKDGMFELKKKKLFDPILKYAESDRPLLGICLGMQMLAGIGQEFGKTEGLNLIPGRVTRIPTQNEVDHIRRVPYVGWADVNFNDNYFQDSSFYFVHSYQFEVENQSNLLATYIYDDIEITAAVCHKNIVGVQFHPEKSGEHGLDFLKKFISPRET